MCGIFGLILKKPFASENAFRVLQSLEISKYPDEKTPVGGYGAGVVFGDANGRVNIYKVGKTASSPVKRLARMIGSFQTRLFLGHVRMPSPQFMNTSEYTEAAQPYLATCFPDLKVYSAHNGYVSNYQELRAALGKTHVLESEKIGLIDSEVIPHVFEDQLRDLTAHESLNRLKAALDGSLALALLQTGQQGTLLHLLHKGKTRGLHVWTNDDGEMIFSSRVEPITKELKQELSRSFVQTLAIEHQEERSFKQSFPLRFSN